MAGWGDIRFKMAGCTTAAQQRYDSSAQCASGTLYVRITAKARTCFESMPGAAVFRSSAAQSSVQALHQHMHPSKVQQHQRAFISKCPIFVKTV